MSVAIIINPHAGVHRRGAAARRVALAREVLQAEGISGEVVVTKSGEHTRELARSVVETGIETVVAWGGDGTINHVGSELVGGKVPLGIVPAGSGNGLARELGLEWNPRRALVTALRGRTRTIDVGDLGGKYFFNVAGTGLDSQLAQAFESGRRRGLGGYAAALFRELGGYEPKCYTVSVAGAEPEEWLRGKALIVALANTRQYGNRAVIAPLARPDDGLLEVVVIPPLSLLSTLWHARRLFTSSVHQIPGVRMRSVRGGAIAADQPMTFHLDGEVVTAAETLSIAVRPGALAVRVPAVSS